MFDKPEAQPAWAKYGAETVNTPANRETVLAAAAQGLVLLVNKAKALPLKTSAVKRLALVGPNVQNIVTKDCGTRKEPSYLGCEGCYCANAIDPISPRTGFAMHAANVDYVAGCTTIMCDPEEKDEPGGWQDAATAAGKADATVVIVGLDVTQECEGHDRMNVTAPSPRRSPPARKASEGGVGSPVVHRSPASGRAARSPDRRVCVCCVSIVGNQTPISRSIQRQGGPTIRSRASRASPR
jgi:beta-glucosidase-like glycosyl hydrolase